MTLKTCPVCNNETLVEGDWGDYCKVQPDTCDNCGYMEGNGSPQYPGNYEFVKKCWELQVSPYPGYVQ